MVLYVKGSVIILHRLTCRIITHAKLARTANVLNAEITLWNARIVLRVTGQMGLSARNNVMTVLLG